MIGFFISNRVSNFSPLMLFRKKSALLLLQNNIALSQKSNKCNIKAKQTEKDFKLFKYVHFQVKQKALIIKMKLHIMTTITGFFLCEKKCS